MSYGDDFNEWIYPQRFSRSAPFGIFWFEQINTDYVKNKEIFHCPNDTDFAFDYNLVSYGSNLFGSSLVAPWKRITGFGRSFKAGGETEAFPVKLSLVKRPSNTIMVADSDKDLSWGATVTRKVIYAAGVVGSRHGGGANILWTDGHVNWQPFAVIDSTVTWWNRNY